MIQHNKISDLELKKRIRVANERRWFLSVVPPRSDIKAKGLCLYNKDDFNWRLTRIQRKKLLKHHGRELMITTTPTVK